jgi:hypothetical protein
VIQDEDGAIAPSRDCIRVVLPLPPKALHPNARVHWRVKYKATREYRRAAYFAAWAALGRPQGLNPIGPMWESATVQIVFYAPDKRKRDADGILSSLKSALDGLAAPTHNGIGAGIIANDSGFSFLPVIIELDRERPRVEMIVSRT